MRRPMLWIIAAWFLFTFGPLLGVLIASAVAGAYGCRLDEAASYPCVVWGRDVGGLLSGLFVLGWLMLVTLPVGGLAAVMGAAVWTARRWGARPRP